MRCSFVDPFCCVSLNNKKAADEFGLLAKQLKHSGKVRVVEITATFNQILQSKTVPDAFKSGILTPVLKKSKDPTVLDNCLSSVSQAILYDHYLR